jgi:hypothetical protein
MPTRTQYRSAGSERIRELLRQLNQLKVLPFGYPNDLAERTGCTLNAARETVKGRSANLVIVEQLVKDAEAILKLKSSKPKKEDYSSWSMEALLEQKLLPNNFAELAGQMIDVSPATVHVVTSGKGKSERIEEALKVLAGKNQELEIIHRLERILEAAAEKNKA